MARVVLVLATALALAGCNAPPPDVSLGGSAPSEPSEAPRTAPSDALTAWRYLATTEGTLPDGAAAVAVESAADLDAAWQRDRLPGRVPAVDFDRAFVLLLTQPDDACVDTLVGLQVVGGALKPEWLPPPGGCAQPLIFRIHAVEIDRRFVPGRFEVAFEEPYERDATPVTIKVQTVRGEPPPPPEAPAAMGPSQLDAVFAGHAVRRCTKKDERPGNEPIDLPVSTLSENEAMLLMDKVQAWLRAEGYRSDVDFVPFLDRRRGPRPGLWVDGGKADDVRRKVDAKFGKGVVLVEENGYDFDAVNRAQRKLGPLMDDVPFGEPGSLSSTTGLPGPVMIGMIDPTREALDRVAATVDPKLVCVSPELSGVNPVVGSP